MNQVFVPKELIEIVYFDVLVNRRVVNALDPKGLLLEVLKVAQGFVKFVEIIE